MKIHTRTIGGIAALLTVLIFACCGCFDLVVSKTSKIPEKFPDYSKSIPAPAEIAMISAQELAPLTPEARKKVLDTVANLKAEAAALREILNNYQNYAATKNKEFEAYIKEK